MNGGIPQGSALRPLVLLFLTYMNTLPSGLVMFYYIVAVYTDDTTLVCSGLDPAATARASVMNQQLAL